ncbi:MAG: hypothetical protein AAF587_00330 [Bacteroidota bacterium]
MTDKEVGTSRTHKPVGRINLNEVINLIEAGNREQAFQLFFQIVSPSLRGLLSKRYRWTKEEADTLIHDTYLLIEEKVLEGHLVSVNYSYVKRTCLNLGANQYRHAMVQEGRYQKYVEQAREDYLQALQDSSGIDLKLFGEFSDHPLRYKKALIAFEQLEERCKKIIYFRHVKGLTHKEIAAQLPNIKNADSSKTLLNRCMKKWTKLLDSL